MTTILFLIIAYLLGSIPSGLWIGKYFFHKNLRDFGSGNTGSTNTFRVLGKKAGIAVFAIDMLKGTIATALPIMFGLHTFSPALFGLCAIFGHTFSIFDHFHGGKGVATSLGMILGYNPKFMIFVVIIFLVMVYLTSMVSMSSIVSGIIAFLATLIFPALHFIFTNYDWLFTFVILFITCFIICKHRDNIARIRNKTENIFNFGLNITHQKHNI
ncbi:glycerol-3-phosphate acyltransferase [Lactococcus hodotermopsidis]|uniref:Glycerol-3-phosphate acyltransferase n=1 Tax=Pseudolactococcus hodotermopsidis TaxID=2709157 RepID=A0A6A0B986_9LACT|nr:glycerol-3-phosphate 1-O-acyltransferase PlsY [Lactococcus hodotermopsidis]GFH41989.1 glycerol-3-phosphate acyltransferase [Lactococcus hodotermopsidis]